MTPIPTGKNSKRKSNITKKVNSIQLTFYLDLLLNPKKLRQASGKIKLEIKYELTFNDHFFY